MTTLQSSAELMGRVTQDLLRSLSALPDEVWGRSRLHIAMWLFDPYDIVRSHDSIGKMLSLRINEWAESDEGAWVLENIPGIEAQGMYDASSDQMKVLVSARVDEPLRIDHAMRWL